MPPSYKTSIHLNLIDNLNSSGQSCYNETEDSEEEDSKLIQFQRVFKHLEVSDNFLLIWLSIFFIMHGYSDKLIK